MFKYVFILILFFQFTIVNYNIRAENNVDILFGTNLSFISTFGQVRQESYFLGSNNLEISTTKYNNNINSSYLNANFNLGIGDLKLVNDTSNISPLKGWALILNLSRNFHYDVELLNTSYNALLYFKVFDSIPIIEDILFAPVVGLTFNTYAVHFNNLNGTDIYYVNRVGKDGKIFPSLSNMEKVSILQNTNNINIGLNTLYPIYSNQDFDLFLNSSMLLMISYSSEVKFSYGNGFIDITEDVKKSNLGLTMEKLVNLSHHNFTFGLGIVAKYNL